MAVVFAKGDGFIAVRYHCFCVSFKTITATTPPMFLYFEYTGHTSAQTRTNARVNTYFCALKVVM